MYHSDFKLEVDDKEINEEIFKVTNSYLQKTIEQFKENVLNSVVDDIEQFMYERFLNIQERYFNEVVAFLLDKDTYSIEQTTKLRLKDWLTGLGYDQESFRRKIYQDNKEDIIKQIEYDAIYEKVKNMFNGSHFKHWNFDDININYPQSQVVRGFLSALVDRSEFQEELGRVIDKRNKQKLDELNELKEEIRSLQNKINKLDQELRSDYSIGDDYGY